MSEFGIKRAHKAALAGMVAAVVFAGSLENLDVDTPTLGQGTRHERKKRLVQSYEYSNGMRVVTFKPRGEEVLAQVVELCEDGDLIQQARYLQRRDGRYFPDSFLRITRDAEVCSDDKISRADGDSLGVPTPPSPSPLPSPRPQTPPSEPARGTLS